MTTKDIAWLCLWFVFLMATILTKDKDHKPHNLFKEN